MKQRQHTERCRALIILLEEEVGQPEFQVLSHVTINIITWKNGTPSCHSIFENTSQSATYLA